jgi:C1A family cysteine protease
MDPCGIYHNMIINVLLYYGTFKMLLTIIPLLFMFAETTTANSLTSPTFEEFVSTYQKIYSTQDEFTQRKAIFEENIINIDNLRKLNPKATFQLNEDADLRLEEFRERNTGFNYKDADLGSTASTASTTTFENLAVKKIDWRTFGAVDPTIFTQGDCGCCWAISVTQTVGSQYFLKKNLSAVSSLSFQQLICCDCGNVDAGCHGGDPHVAYNYIINAGGLETNKVYPFTDSGPDAQSCNLNDKCNLCKFNKKDVVASIKGYINVTQADRSSGNPGNETKLAEVLGKEGPISVCIDSDPWRFYSSGILSYGARNLNHCVQLIGYDTTYSTKYWILKNSWGEKWGEDGYIRMEMGMDVCGVADVATMPLV